MFTSLTLSIILHMVILKRQALLPHLIPAAIFISSVIPYSVCIIALLLFLNSLTISYNFHWYFSAAWAELPLSRTLSKACLRTTKQRNISLSNSMDFSITRLTYDFSKWFRWFTYDIWTSDSLFFFFFNCWINLGSELFWSCSVYTSLLRYKLWNVPSTFLVS